VAECSPLREADLSLVLFGTLQIEAQEKTFMVDAKTTQVT